MFELKNSNYTYPSEASFLSGVRKGLELEHLAQSPVVRGGTDLKVWTDQVQQKKWSTTGLFEYQQLSIPELIIQLVSASHMG